MVILKFAAPVKHIIKRLSMLMIALGLFWFAQPAELCAEPTEARIAALEQKFANLERTCGERITQLEKQIQSLRTASVNTDDPLAQKARESLANVRKLAAEGNAAEAKKQLTLWLAEYGSTKLAVGARRLETELAVVGKDAPKTWEISEWVQGKDSVDLSREKPILLIFWELWCPHCKRELPALQSRYEELKKNGIEIATFTKLTRGVSKEQIGNYLSDNKITLPVAKENGQLSEYFGVSGVPAAAVIENGKVAWRGHPSQVPQKYLSVQ